MPTSSHAVPLSSSSSGHHAPPPTVKAGAPPPPPTTAHHHHGDEHSHHHDDEPDHEDNDNNELSMPATGLGLCAALAVVGFLYVPGTAGAGMGMLSIRVWSVTGRRTRLARCGNGL